MAMALAALELQKSERFNVPKTMNDLLNGLYVKRRKSNGGKIEYVSHSYFFLPNVAFTHLLSNMPSHVSVTQALYDVA